MYRVDSIIRDLPSCIVQKFNRSEILKTQLKTEGKRRHESIEIIYEPVNDERSIKSNESYCSRKVKHGYKTQHPATRQCYYCNKYFGCTLKAFLIILIPVLILLELFTNLKTAKLFVFKTIPSTWQICLLPFILISKPQPVTALFTTPKCLSNTCYCQIYAFHPELKLDKIVIFRSFD